MKNKKIIFKQDLGISTGSGAIGYSQNITTADWINLNIGEGGLSCS
jgi:hypothetical protein